MEKEKILRQFAVDLGHNWLVVFYSNVSYDKATCRYSYRIGDMEVASSEELIEKDFSVRKLSLKDLFWKNIYDFDDLIGRILLLAAIPLFGIPLFLLLILLVKSVWISGLNGFI